MMLHQEINTDDVYLNDFHREWNKRCLETDAKMPPMHFTHEFLRAQSQRMNELVRQEEERLRRKRKNS